MRTPHCQSSQTPKTQLFDRRDSTPSYLSLDDTLLYFINLSLQAFSTRKNFLDIIIRSFLFMVKCPVVAKKIDCEVGNMILFYNLIRNLY